MVSGVRASGMSRYPLVCQKSSCSAVSPALLSAAGGGEMRAGDMLGLVSILLVQYCDGSLREEGHIITTSSLGRPHRASSPTRRLSPFVPAFWHFTSYALHLVPHHFKLSCRCQPREFIITSFLSPVDECEVGSYQGHSEVLCPRRHLAPVQWRLPDFADHVLLTSSMTFQKNHTAAEPSEAHSMA